MKMKQKTKHKQTQDQKELRNTETNMISFSILPIIKQIYFRRNNAHCTSLLNLNTTAEISSVKIHHS